MKRRIFTCLFLCALLVPLCAKPAPAKSAPKTEAAPLPPYQAPPSKFGVGIFLGQPTGLSFGIDIGSTSWLDFKAAWDFAGGSTKPSSFSLLFQGDYQICFPGILVIQRNDIVPYVGLGAEVAVNATDATVGIRIPLGLDYRFVAVPIELKLEAGLGMSLYPSTNLSASGGIAIRYRF